MTFVRTKQGLMNAAQFYGVRAVVYVEGRLQQSEADVGSLDLLFWKQVFAEFAPNFSVHIVCRGSKEDLLAIANQIISGAVANVIVAMDRDFDPELGLCLNHPAVLYTYGYSWESDVWCEQNVVSLVEQNSLVQPVPQPALAELRAAYGNLLGHSSRVARLNLAAALFGVEYVLQTSEYRGLIKVRKSAVPSFDLGFARQRLREWRRTNGVALSLQGLVVEPRKHCLGHLVAHFAFHLACAFLRRLGHRATIDFDMFSAFAVKCFGEFLALRSDDCAAYYERTVRAVPGVT